MQKLQEIHLLLPLLLFYLLHITSAAPYKSPSFCGKIQLQPPLSIPNSSMSSPLSQMVLCKTENLYFRTSIGLFPISSIDYTNKLLTISQSSCSSLNHFVSPSLLSAGLPSSTRPNTLALFNCLNTTHPMLSSSSSRNCTQYYGCSVASELQEQNFHACLVLDYEKLGREFDPKHLKCSHYSRVYMKYSFDQHAEYELGTRISFDVPDNVTDICHKCEKPDGNCGVGLKCICHPNQCKDRVVSLGTIMEPIGMMVLCTLAQLSWFLLLN